MTDQMCWKTQQMYQNQKSLQLNKNQQTAENLARKHGKINQKSADNHARKQLKNLNEQHTAEIRPEYMA